MCKGIQRVTFKQDYIMATTTNENCIASVKDIHYITPKKGCPYFILDVILLEQLFTFKHFITIY